MKVIEQLIAYCRYHKLLTPEQIDALCKKGFIKIWEMYDQGTDASQVEEPVEIEEELVEPQDVLENVSARKGKLPDRRRPHSKSRRRWWRDHIGRKKQMHRA